MTKTKVVAHDLFPANSSGCGNALLVDPHPGKYLSIPLMKLSTYLKARGYRTYYHGGITPPSLEYDLILVTTLFSFHWRDYIEAVNNIRRHHPLSKILIGGAYASFFPDQIQNHTGITPVQGNIPEVDECAPDQDLIREHAPEQDVHIFTTKGCPRGCTFCGSARMEDKPHVISSWRDHIPVDASYCVIHDNNILAHGDDHFSAVMKHFERTRLRYLFDNGFDCRLFEKHHARMVAATKCKQVRFAFDTMEEDGYAQNAIRMCIDEGIKPRGITVFILYNFNDDLDDAMYRAREIHKLGARPWAMQFTPLKWGNDTSRYLSRKWNREEARLFRLYVNKFGMMQKYTYEGFKEAHAIWKKNRQSHSQKSEKSPKRYALIGANIDPESLFNNEELISRLFDDR